MVQLLNKGYNLSIEKIGNVVDLATECQNNFWSNIFWYFFFPLIIVLLIFLLIKYFSTIREWLLKKIATKGYIKIMFITENKRIKTKYKKLDKFTNFQIGKRKFTLEKMYDFLIGYDKNGFPTFLYDFQFILPLKITKENIDTQIKKQLNLDEDDSDKISAMSMMIDSNILETVYKKKLISDLYSISKDSLLSGNLLYIVIGLIVLAFLYFTGYLEQIINYLL